ncbi:MAG: acetate/propionate family kinase [Paracoccaceae bacterium]
MRNPPILTLNAGSSSLKFALYAGEDQRLRGQVERIGSPQATLKLARREIAIGGADHAGALNAILEAIAPNLNGQRLAGIGHRIVHGGVEFAAPAVLTPEVMHKLEALSPLAPLHQPHNLAAVRAAQTAFPGVVQIGCFDTAFHRGHPWVNDTFALPRALYEQGIRRYGFHGLSYDYITSHIAAHHPELRDARVVIAHLGNGASICATRGGKSIGSTMGFSALDGLAMGTRCGQLDPGVLLYLMGERGMSVEAVSNMLYRESGLKGLSGISSDMRELEASDAREAREAIDYFTFRIRRELGAMSAILGGIDALIFCGGIGENSARVRADVAAGMGYLGLEIDAAANAENAAEIGAGQARIMAVKTDEERVIARAVLESIAAK